MEFIMLCYPVREVMLWQWVGNPDCLVSHQVVSRSAASCGGCRHTSLFGKGRPNLGVRWMRQRREPVSTPVTYTAHLSL